MNTANTAVLDMSEEFQQTGGFEQKQASVLARAIYKSREDLATKKDLIRVRKDFDTSLRLVKSELSTEIEKTRTEIAKSQTTTIYAAVGIIVSVLAINAYFTSSMVKDIVSAAALALASAQAVEADADVSSLSPDTAIGLDAGTGLEVDIDLGAGTPEPSATSGGTPDGQ